MQAYHNPLWNICRELHEEMPGDNVRNLITIQKLEKQHWAATGDGTSFEWWRWNTGEKDPETGEMRTYASLDIELRENKLFAFTCYLYAGGILQEHRCIFDADECPHFQKNTPQEPASTPAPTRKVIWEY
jgi:hypothetical protein